MIEPAPAQPSENSAPVILRLLLAFVLLIPGIAGLCAFLLLAATWAIQGFKFEVSDLGLMPILLFVAEVCILFSVVTVGIVLRYARWKKAYIASLTLSLVSLLTIVLGHQMMIDALGSVDAGDKPGLMIITAIVILIVSGPPFLHWWKAPKAGGKPAN